MSKDKNRAPYHLTITDNITGEVLRDLHFGAIIAGISVGPGESAGLALYSCEAEEHAEAVTACELTLKREYDGDPDLRGLVELFTKTSVFEKENSERKGE